MKKYHIRYNTEHKESDLVWRIFENGKETLVKRLKINVPSFDECTFENGIQKWNICCIGNLKINNGIAEIN
jgi:hypothetical protein